MKQDVSMQSDPRLKRKQKKQKQTMHVFTVSAVCNKIVIVYLCTCLRVFERKSGQTAEADIYSFFLFASFRV